MEEYEVDILPGELLEWVREDAARKTPEMRVRASKEYQVATDYDRSEAGLGEEESEDIAPVAVRGMMEIAPRRGEGGWTLQLRAEEAEAILPADEDDGFEDESDMTVEAFVSQFLLPEHGEVETIVVAEDAAAWQRFQRWFERHRARPVTGRLRR